MLEVLEVLEEKHVTPTREMTQVLARCLACGAIHKILWQSFRKHNRQKRAFCKECVKETFHHLTRSRIYRTWRGMRARCEDPLTKGYKHYGGRGITVCERWQKFENFYEDMRDGYSETLTIERIDVNGGYSKDNCRWATNAEQQANKRNNRILIYKGSAFHMAELCRLTKVSKMKMWDRLSRGMTPEEAVLSARASTYGTGRTATKGRMSMTSSTVGHAVGS